MPATVAHAFFVKDVLDSLPSDIKNCLSISRCKMFGQSTDSLMFYNLFSVMPGKKIRKLHKIFHSKYSQDFFFNLLRYIKDNNINDKDTLSFLVGFICHYTLDSIMHPYIIYKSGYFNKKDSSTFKYNGEHAIMETFIDNDMIKRRYSGDPYKFRIDDYCFDLDSFSTSLSKTIDYSFYNTFFIKDMSKIYYKSLKQMRFALVHFRRDPYGIKRVIYRFIDTFTPKSTFRLETISYHFPIKDNNYLNRKHKLWRNPSKYNITSNESFIDLYIRSIKYAKVLICASFDYINNKGIDLSQIFTNNSYITGLNCDEDNILKYFEK